VFFFMPIFEAPRGVNRGRTKSQNNLHQIGLAILVYEDVQKRLPPRVVYSPDGKPLYSWRVLLLPYLEEKSLYEDFHLDEPWDSPHNNQLLSRIPPIYVAPTNREEPLGVTHYQAFAGTGTGFEDSQPIRLPDDFPDGTTKTLLVVEAANPIPWTKPEDLVYEPDKPLPPLGRLYEAGFNAAFADGSVRLIPRQTKEEVIRALITRNGHERVEIPGE
jgi:prepilin-type processing-associated H-X9-DG protein